MVNGKNLRNSNSIPAYKAQLYIYNKIVSEIQGLNSRYSFILGKNGIITIKIIFVIKD